MAEGWQLRFDSGRQQRYLPDRRTVLQYVLAIAGQSQDPVFEVWRDAEPVLLADGRTVGRRFVRDEVIDMRVAGTAERLRRELTGESG